MELSKAFQRKFLNEDFLSLLYLVNKKLFIFYSKLLYKLVCAHYLPTLNANRSPTDIATCWHANMKKKKNYRMIFVDDLLVDFLNTEKDVYMLPFICELDSHPVMSFI